MTIKFQMTHKCCMCVSYHVDGLSAVVTCGLLCARQVLSNCANHWDNGITRLAVVDWHILP